jgi:hypothetical protein
MNAYRHVLLRLLLGGLTIAAPLFLAVRAVADLGEITYRQPIVLPSINLNHLKISGLPDLLFTVIGRLLCANPVACENALAGTPPSDWGILEPGDASIQGFATEQSVNAGDSVRFKIKTTASAYHIDILRAGWYQGNGARKVAAGLRPSPSLPQAQPACLVDTNATGLIDCGNWADSASWAVPRNAVSGVYFARLVRDDTGGSSYVFFVVRDDSRRSDIVYQTSDTTRAAYNPYGGNSLYLCTVQCPPGSPEIYKGAAKVSFNRPNTAAAKGMQHSFFGAELALIQFLEANGYDMSYISGVDTDRASSQLTRHRVFISSGHDEYWSGDQRANVERARDAGVHLAFFSGNEAFWKTRYEASIDGHNTPYRTLVTYKETHFNKPVDPLDPVIWTGLWRDPRYSPPADGGRPENALSGTMYSVDPPANFPIEVPAADGKMRLWRNTTVATQAAGQLATLAPNTLGYEWNTDYDNGARPAGVVHLSTTTRTVPSLLVDVGNTYSRGVATHHMSLHRVASCALVFGAGTVQWSWGLEGSPDGATQPDSRMQQATVNLLADMGVQPTVLLQTLTPARASSDTVPPSSAITSHAAGARVASNAMVNIVGTAQDAGGGVVGAVEVSTDGGLTWHAANGRENWIYQWTPINSGTLNVLSRAVDDSGNLEKPTNGVSMAVAPRGCPCTIWPSTAAPIVSAAPESTPIEIGVKFYADADGRITGLRFFKARSNIGTHMASLWTANGTLLARASFANETESGWQQVNFSNPVAVTAGTHYVASYHTSAGHYAGDHDYFASNFDNAPLHALKAGADGGNGVYTYSKDSVFPTSSYKSTNYWVDVVFAPNSAATQ